MSNSRVQTTAETDLLTLFTDQFQTLPGSSNITMIRDQAIENLKQNGLPTRRIESWHYTDLRTLLRDLPTAQPKTQNVMPLLKNSHILNVTDGIALNGLVDPNVSVTHFSQQLEDGSCAEILAPRGDDDSIGIINTAFVRDGYHIDIKDNYLSDTPIEVLFEANLHAHTRAVVGVGKGANLTLIERHVGGNGFVSSVTHVTINEGAHLTYIIDQERDLGAVHLGQLNVTLHKDATLTLFVMNCGGKLARQEVHIKVQGENAHFNLRGINLIKGDLHSDITVTLTHEVPHTTSSQIIRNVVTQNGSGVFQGQIRVFPEAQKTDAKMACNTLLLSDDAKFSSKPELEIFADDVQCGHGATVREVEAQHLFYLMARGISEPLARGLLVKAFVAEIIEELDHEELVEALEQKLDDWLKNTE
jgi:Fe-S cluster assembly protein SufD